MAFLRCRETCGAVISDYRQLCFRSEFFEKSLPAINEWPDNPEVTFIYRIVSFHRAQITIMESTHDEGLSEIVQVLAHRYHIEALSTRTVVDHATFHARAESTY